MKRLLVIFMLVVIPFQLSWAAAAVYCEHEINPTTLHFGHHEHKHIASPNEVKADASKAAAAVDGDCTSCHLGGIAILTIPLPALALDIISAPLIISSNSLLASSRPSRPERPKWTVAVS
ncbi:putative periplasmic cation efflux system protein czcI [Herminiimonas arsenicoxydans]|uniref:Periplasmic cation efflux system protein czcI n=1 Tax=Herminiimonas arsenicoxydans TaxID=204773 RepID=A4G2J4_HERAR|nr:putative periplasmic cation efflux system protein czcI [Herminiimonas arsenicoxydans]